jgi:DNA-binding LacI/PurR family transcriptional regulator
MAKKIKNKDLAAKLGVSNTLVSLVLNNKADQHGIMKETQEKVLSLARQMGYFESLDEENKRSPVEEKPGVMGMIVPSVNSPFVEGISVYLQQSFSGIGLGFSIVTKDPDDQRYDRLINAFRKFFSGLILVGDAADDNTIRTLRSADYPFVILEKHIKNLRLNTICTDFVAGADLVVNHVEKLGYRNVIILSDRRSHYQDAFSVHALNDAFKQKSGIPAPVIAEFDKQMTDEQLNFNLFEKYLRPPYRAEMIISMNANMVFPLMTFLRKKKIRVPQDIAVMSMEEGTGFDLMYSPVTCLRKPLAAMAGKVANMIWSEVKNSGKGKFKRQVNISPELIVRKSCGTL